MDLELAFAPFAVLLEQHLPPEVLLEPVACLLADAEEFCLLFFMIISPYLLSNGKCISTKPWLALHSGQMCHASFDVAR